MLGMAALRLHVVVFQRFLIQSIALVDLLSRTVMSPTGGDSSQPVVSNGENTKIKHR